MATPNSSATKPLASLTRLSPSRMSTTRCGNASLRAIDVAAIASVVATTAPSTMPSSQVKPGKNILAVRATLKTVKATKPKASRAMLTRLKRNSRQEVTHAAEYSRGGSTTRKIKSGLSLICGIPGTKPRTRPAITRTIGYGICSLRANAAKTATNASNNRNTSSTE